MMEKLDDLLGRMSLNIRRALYEKRSGDPKLDGWCGVEAYMRIRTDLPLIHLGYVPKAKADAAVLYAGIAYRLDPGQQPDAITVCLNGAPIRRVDTKAMKVETITGPEGVRAIDLEALHHLFRNSDKFYTERSGMLTSKLTTRVSDDLSPDEPLKMRTRHFSFHEWQMLGLVYSPEPKVWAITLAGKNAIEQWRAFS